MRERKAVVCCGCAQACGLRVTVEDNRVVDIGGDRGHPVSGGYVCPKGTHATDLLYAPDRVRRPLRRRGARGSGEWDEISWDQALDEIAAGITRITAAHGREALAYAFGTLHSAEWGIGERFLNLFGSPNTVGQDKICYGPTAVGEAITYGFGPSTFTYPTAGVTRCVVLWGMRPSASAPLLWMAIRAARKAGAKLVVVDPERTREAREADLFLQIVPGTDVALGLGLIGAMIAAGRYDAAFVAARTTGFDALAERAARYDPDTVAALCRVPAAHIREAAALISDHRPTLFSAGNGLCQQGPMAVQNGRVIACLVALTGDLDRDGGNCLAGPPRDIVSNGAAMAVDALAPAQRAKRLGGDRFPFIGEGYTAFDQAVSTGWYGQRNLLSWSATAHQPSLWRAITDADPYPVKALVVQHHNPLGAGANARAAQAALAHDNLELLVVQDLFVNPTSRHADFLLPAAHWLEVPYFSLGYGYMAFVGDYVAANHAAVAPIGEVHSDYELWRDLAARLGQADRWPERAEAFWDTCLAPAGLDFATVAAAVGPLTGAAARAPGAQTPASAGGRYGTPSGRIELASSLLGRWGLDALPEFVRPALFERDPAGYPLILTTGGRAIEGFHQNAQQMSCFRRKYAEPEVSLNACTARESGVGDGEWVWIETPLGAVRHRVRLTDRLADGVVRADRWWYPERADDAHDPFGFVETNINFCTDDDDTSCDAVAGSWLLRGLPCRLRRSDGPLRA